MPSYGYLKSEIDRLNKNFELLSGWNGQGEISLKNSIGEFKTIYSVDGSLSPSKISQIETPSSFVWKPNWFLAKKTSFIHYWFSIHYCLRLGAIFFQD
jgi:hypothetical protein